MRVYFVDPYSPWQRGTNENTNGLFKHYCMKAFHPDYFAALVGIDWADQKHDICELSCFRPTGLSHHINDAEGNSYLGK